MFLILFSPWSKRSCDGRLAHFTHVPRQFDFITQIAATDNDSEGAFDPPARELARHRFGFDATRGFERGHIDLHVARLNCTCSVSATGFGSLRGCMVIHLHSRDVRLGSGLCGGGQRRIDTLHLVAFLWQGRMYIQLPSG